MHVASVNGVELEYEVRGAGEPVLLVNPVLADGFLPLMSERSLTSRYRLIRYHKRGWAGSTHSTPPVSIADHAQDAAALLDRLDVGAAHVVGHSSSGAVALQLALDRPECVHSLVLLEPGVLSVPGGEAFLRAAGPAFEAYAAGDHQKALELFLAVASGLEWETCRALLERRLPGAIASALKDANTFFGIELPSLTEWEFDAASAARVSQPVLSVLGSQSGPLWREIADLLRSSLPRVEERTIEGVGHFLHIQRPQPVARAIATFLRSNPMSVSTKRFRPRIREISPASKAP